MPAVQNERSQPNILDSLMNAAKGGYQFLKEHPISYEQTGPGGTSSFSSQGLHEQYKKEQTQKTLATALTELSQVSTPQERTAVLAKYPSLMEMIKGPFGEYLYPDPIKQFVVDQLTGPGGGSKLKTVGTDNITVDVK